MILSSSRWIMQMAWRDSRSFRRRLILFTGSISVGIAALVAIGSLAVAIEQEVDAQANALLGADMVISSRQPFAVPVLALFDSLGGQQARQVNFSSMGFFPKKQSTRLVQVRALAGGFPFYGTFQTEPAEAVTRLHQGKAYALVDEGLMLQLELSRGDSVKIGAVMFEIVGQLQKIPGEATAMGSLAPRIYIPMAYLERTRLVQFGSRVSYYAFFKFAGETDIATLAISLEEVIRQYHLDLETVEKRQQRVGRVLSNVYEFLNLGSFIALLLGSVGVASAVHTYVKQKLSTVAILHSLGASARQTFSIYLAQALGMGLIGACTGVLGAAGVLFFLPQVFGEYLPIDIKLTLALRPVLEGTGVGLGVALLFAGVPLLAIRRVSPLLALRNEYETEGQVWRDPWAWGLFVASVGALVLFALNHTRHWYHGIGFILGLGVVFALLSLAGWSLSCGVRRFFPSSWSYVWRQGLANLYRPHNQTLTLIIALGLGTFLLTTIYLLQTSLLTNIQTLGGAEQPNIVLFDIQQDQRQEVVNLVDSFDLPVIEQVPVVAMRLAQINGRDIEDIRRDTLVQVPQWALAREYRSTYRDYLSDTETIVAGQWRGQIETLEDSIFISMDQSLAANLELEVGDELVFDVQGVQIVTYIGSLRRVDWKRIKPNFLLVFPTGVLELAPQFHVVVSRTDSKATSAALQRQAVQDFPNVSIVDLDLVLITAENILAKVALIIRFMALFSMATGLVVLLGVITSSHFQRVREIALLKILGARRSQVRSIMALEYFFLGFFAALSGGMLALVGTWALSTFVFKVPFQPVMLPLVIVVALVSCTTVLVGMLTSQSLVKRSPLEVLRSNGI